MVAVGILDALTLVILMRIWVRPSDLGIATLATSLSPVLDLLADLGVQTAIVRAPSGPDGRPALAGVFRFHVLAAVALLILVTAIAFPLAAFHGHGVVAWLLVGYAVKLVIQSFGTVSGALLRRDLRFGHLAVTRVAATLADCTARLGFAAAGQPILCFVAGQLAYSVVTTTSLQAARPYLPAGSHRQGPAIPTPVRFGLTTSAASLLYEFYSNFDYQVVGLRFGNAALGLYRAAFDVVLYVVHFVSGITVDVALPSLVKLRENPDAFRAHFLHLVSQNLRISLPAVGTVLLLAPQLLELVFPAYAAGASIARILAVVGLIRCASAVFPSALHAIGRPGLHVAVMGVSALCLPVAFGLSAYLLGDRLGMMAVAYAWVALYPILFVIFAAVTLRAVAVPVAQYLVVLGRSLLAAAGALLPAVLAHAVLPPSVPLFVHVLVVATIVVAGATAFAAMARRNVQPSVIGGSR